MKYRRAEKKGSDGFRMTLQNEMFNRKQSGWAHEINYRIRIFFNKIKWLKAGVRKASTGNKMQVFLTVTMIKYCERSPLKM